MNEKSSKNNLKKCFMWVIVMVFLFGQWMTAQDTQIDKQLDKLKSRLNLSEEQTASVKEILEQVQQQKTADRQTYKTDALALIQAAWTRRNHVDKKIEPILDSQQLETYKELRKLHPVDRELFVLTEGLLLNEEQIFDVEGILIKMYNEFEPLKNFMEMMGEGGDLPPGGPGGGRGGMGPMPMGRGSGRMVDFMNKIEAQKAKAIKKLLTEEQKKLYEQIRKDRRQKMKEQMKRMKERMKRK